MIGLKEILIILVVALIVLYSRKAAGVSLKKSLGLEPMTREDEIRIGRDWLEKIRKKEEVEPEDDPRVARILEKLSATGKLRFKSYKVFRHATPHVNAMALPGGYILTTRGLMRLPDLSEEELAGILAHEMGHIELRHSRRALVRKNQKQALLTVLAVIGRNPGWAVGAVSFLAEMGISRESELAADDFAIKLLSSAGYSHAGLLRFFERARSFQRLPDWLTFMSTHPALEERIERLEKLPVRRC